MEFILHGHSVGGTNPSLVEAMSLGLCCAVYKVDYNVETTENKAIYFSNIEELKNILNDFTKNLLPIEEKKNEMLEIAQRKYLWKNIVKKYENIF